MGYARLRFAVSMAASLTVVVSLIVMLLSTQIAMAALPLADVVGVGGLYLSADSFQGGGAEVYPVRGQDVGSGSGVDADTPVCMQRPMLAIELDTAEVSGFQARKDVQLPHLQDRWMTIEISQPDSGKIYGDTITFYTTQLQVDQLDIRNIVIRESQPGQFASQDARVNPRDQNLGATDAFGDTVNPTQDKFGPYSGEFYIEGGNAPNNPGLDAQGAEAWLHAVTGEGITFNTTSDFDSGIDVLEEDDENRTELKVGATHPLGTNMKFNISARTTVGSSDTEYDSVQAAIEYQL